MRRIATGVLLASIIVVSIAAIAPAHTAKYSSSVGGYFSYYEEGGLYPDKGVFAGVVSSGQGKCQSKRTVKVFYRETGSPFGSDTTNAEGDFEVFAEDPPAEGDYFAEATKKTFGGSGHKHICKVARSSNDATVSD